VITVLNGDVLSLDITEIAQSALKRSSGVTLTRCRKISDPRSLRSLLRCDRRAKRKDQSKKRKANEFQFAPTNWGIGVLE
jgi:hypothetical protein